MDISLIIQDVLTRAILKAAVARRQARYSRANGQDKHCCQNQFLFVLAAGVRLPRCSFGEIVEVLAKNVENFSAIKAIFAL